MLALSGVAETREDVFSREVRKVREHLLFCHPGREVRQDVIDGNAHASDAWLPATLSRLNRDDPFIRHVNILDERGFGREVDHECS